MGHEPGIGRDVLEGESAVGSMRRSTKWFVEVIQAGKKDPRVEVCESRRQARAIVEEAKAAVGFEPATDQIAIYRGESWATSELFE